MNLSERINAFAQLGKHLAGLSTPELEALGQQASGENRWFTPVNVTMAVRGVQKLLEDRELMQWTSRYSLEPANPRIIGVVMAGNIPMVGFHDFLSVLLSGHRLKAKLSSQDSILLSYLAAQLLKLEPRFKDSIEFAERLNGVDAVIATGSDNSARYFEYYFRNVPQIIRKNRSSIAVLSGNESSGEMTSLGTDIFSYFGLGCRNVSKLYLPSGFDIPKLLDAWKGFEEIIHHSKYVNNYDYQKSILLVNKIPFYDNGFILLKEESSFVSPISVLYYEWYTNDSQLDEKLAAHNEKVQCVVSTNNKVKGSIAPGQAQFPGVIDYADNVDTMKFLSELALT